MGAAENKQLIERYFAAMQSGDPALPDLLCDDVTWWVPPSLPMGGVYEGRAAVLELMGSGVGLYDPDTPLEICVTQMVADDEWVCVQTTIRGRTARGEDYENHYHFAFRIRGDRIAAVQEHLDSAYALEKLFH